MNVVAVDWRVARTAAERLRGLLGYPAPGRGAGLLLPRCRAVHTFGMRYPIDVVFVARTGQVLKVVPALPPNRAAICAAAWATAELAAGEARRLRLLPGALAWLPPV